MTGTRTLHRHAIVIHKHLTGNGHFSPPEGPTGSGVAGSSSVAFTAPGEA